MTINLRVITPMILGAFIKLHYEHILEISIHLNVLMLKFTFHFVFFKYYF